MDDEAVGVHLRAHKRLFLIERIGEGRFASLDPDGDSAGSAALRQYAVLRLDDDLQRVLEIFQGDGVVEVDIHEVRRALNAAVDR